MSLSSYIYLFLLLCIYNTSSVGTISVQKSQGVVIESARNSPIKRKRVVKNIGDITARLITMKAKQK